MGRTVALVVLIVACLAFTFEFGRFTGITQQATRARATDTFWERAVKEHLGLVQPDDDNDDADPRLHRGRTRDVRLTLSKKEASEAHVSAGGDAP